MLMKYYHKDGHSHSHGHAHGENTDGTAKDLAILKYMLDHNRQHALELKDMGARLAQSGNAAAVLIDEAIEAYDNANEKLAEAVKQII